MEPKRSGPRESVRGGRVGGGWAPAAVPETSLDRDGGGGAPHRVAAASTAGVRAFPPQGQSPSSRAVPSSPQPALLTEGPRFSGEWGGAGGGGSAWEPAQSTQRMPHLTSQWSWRLPQAGSSKAHLPLSRLRQDSMMGRPSTLFIQKLRLLVYYFFSLRSWWQPWPQLTSPLRHMGPMRLAHARRLASWESPGPCAPPPSLAKPEQMSADREARTEQGC